MRAGEQQEGKISCIFNQLLNKLQRLSFQPDILKEEFLLRLKHEDNENFIFKLRMMKLAVFEEEGSLTDGVRLSQLKWRDTICNISEAELILKLELDSEDTLLEEFISNMYQESYQRITRSSYLAPYYISSIVKFRHKLCDSVLNHNFNKDEMVKYFECNLRNFSVLLNEVKLSNF